jgi:hypothetical protein
LKKIVQSISPLVGDAGVSIEVFADLNTTADEMLKQGREMNSPALMIINDYVHYPWRIKTRYVSRFRHHTRYDLGGHVSGDEGIE